MGLGSVCEGKAFERADRWVCEGRSDSSSTCSRENAGGNSVCGSLGVVGEMSAELGSFSL